jgi:hypothetical protein
VPFDPGGDIVNQPAHRPWLLALVIFTAVSGCSGLPPNVDGATVVPAGDGSPDPSLPLRIPTEHRSQATACDPSARAPDAGGALCSSDSECGGDAGALASHCLRGRCSFDACLADGDCKNGGVCGCSADYYGGNGAFHPNLCVPSNCHVDADCGAGGFCSPNRGRCGTFEGFYCHRPTDACYQASECPAPAAGGVASCRHAPTVGAFVCSAGEVCNG